MDLGGLDLGRRDSGLHLALEVDDSCAEGFLQPGTEPAPRNEGCELPGNYHDALMDDEESHVGHLGHVVLAPTART